MKNLAIRLKLKRKELELTQKDVAKILHVSERTVINWENDKNIPKTKKQAIENFLQLTLKDMEVIQKEILDIKNPEEMNLEEKIDFILQKIQKIEQALKDQQDDINENALRAWTQNAELQEMILIREVGKVKFKKKNKTSK